MVKVVSHPNHHRTMVFPNFNEPVPAENQAGEALPAAALPVSAQPPAAAAATQPAAAPNQF
ncbi:unnamed protein product [Prunus armeniaca]|uniref:Uncharacterized protein n=1 Tax=Prunus armeniaca TaxID=36596 RepID=A0A6J5TQK3_PRUAR|nr:hypothetical protein GBA52_001772 [Prunus armeniaca]CAB4265952.1 unnamed protein product [Prunus armeniaca]CAB4296535.1 unnamed protein product [Prunus armeniaca]